MARPTRSGFLFSGFEKAIGKRSKSVRIDATKEAPRARPGWWVAAAAGIAMARRTASRPDSPVTARFGDHMAGPQETASHRGARYTERAPRRRRRSSTTGPSGASASLPRVRAHRPRDAGRDVVEGRVDQRRESVMAVIVRALRGWCPGHLRVCEPQ